MQKNFAQNASRNFPKISPKFPLLCFLVFLLCLHYAPKLPTILSFVMSNSAMGYQNCGPKFHRLPLSNFLDIAVQGTRAYRAS